MAQKEKEKDNSVAIKDVNFILILIEYWPNFQLPVYAEPPRITDYRFVEDAPVFGETFFRKLRCSQFMNSIKVLTNYIFIYQLFILGTSRHCEPIT